MSAWGKRQNRSNPYGARLGFESLERRELLAADYVFTLSPGNTVSFKDADGTTVKVKLMGSGSGSFTLTNGLKTGAPIASMTITGTDNTSQLKITAAGGADDVSTIRTLTVTPTIPGPALTQLSTTAINVASGGLLTFNGGVGSMTLNNVNNGGAVVVNGNLNSFIVNSIGSNSSIDVSGTLSSLKVQTLGTGFGLAEVDAQTLTSLSVVGQMNNALVNVGAGGMLTAYLGSATSSAISSAGNIGNVVVNGAVTSTGIAANRSAGSDGILGTLDDYTMSAGAAGLITSVAFNGAVTPGAYGVQVITTGASPTITGPNSAQVEVIDNAISQFIPLQIAQATAGITGFDDDEIWIAVFGQEIVTPTEGETPPTGISYYLDATQLNGSGASATPIPISTATRSVGPGTPDQAILPSFTLAQWKNALTEWGSNLQLPIPTPGNQFTGRILISVGAPVQAQITGAQDTVAAPTSASGSDPSNGTFYDFLEFTVTNFPSTTNQNGNPQLDMDTSQVDSFGLPMQLQFFKDATGAPSSAYNVSFQGTVTPGSATITNITNITGGVLQVGQPVVGAGIKAGSLIDQINGSTIVLSKTAINANPPTPVTTQLTAQNAGPVGVQATRDQLLSESQPLSLMKFLQTQLDANNEKVRPFLQTAAPYQIAGPVPITGAQVDTITNTSNIRIYTNSVAGLNATDKVSVYGVQGMTNANGVYTVGSVDLATNSFTLLNSSVNAGYVSGGVWSIAITGATVPGPGNEITISATNISGVSVNDIIQIVNVSGMTAANGFFIVESVDAGAKTFTLAQSNGSGQTYTPSGTGPGTLSGTWSVYTRNLRLVSPDDLVAVLPAPTSPNGLNNYYNEVIDEFFLTYLPSSATVTGMDGVQRTGKGSTFSIQSNKFNGTMVTYSGTVQNIGSGANPNQWALVLNGGGQTFVVYYPFSTANRPSPNVYQPKFQIGAPQPWPNYGMSASHMIFACTGPFADNPFRASHYNKSDVWSATLGDLENSISAAFNRGIILNDASTWGERSTWFQQTPGTQPPHLPATPSPQRAALYGVYNYWVEYWHQDDIAVNDLAYAFPYDDKFGTSTNLQQNNVGLAQILLNQWSTTQTIDTTTSFGNVHSTPVTPPVSPATPAQGSSVTLAATVAANSGTASPSGTVTFFIDGVPINQNNFGATPPLQPVPLIAGPALSGYSTATLQATLPALPDGSLNRTYTVTAVYSGDATNEPSIAYMPLALTGVNGDFLMGYTGTPSAGNSITITGTALPGGVYNGTIAFSINGTSMGTINVGAGNFTASVKIPSSLTAGYYTISALFTPLSGGPYTGMFGVNVTG